MPTTPTPTPDTRTIAIEAQLQAIVTIATTPGVSLDQRVACVVHASRVLDDQHREHAVLLGVGL